MDFEQYAQELAETWLIGNLTDCIKAIGSQGSNYQAALLAILVYQELTMPQDQKAFKRMLGERIK